MQSDDAMLLYLIDMAIMETRSKASSFGAVGKDSVVGLTDRDVNGSAAGHGPESSTSPSQT